MIRCWVSRGTKVDPYAACCAWSREHGWRLTSSVRKWDHAERGRRASRLVLAKYSCPNWHVCWRARKDKLEGKRGGAHSDVAAGTGWLLLRLGWEAPQEADVLWFWAKILFLFPLFNGPFVCFFQINLKNKIH